MPQSVFPLVPTWVRFVSLLIYCNFASTADFKSNNQTLINKNYCLLKSEIKWQKYIYFKKQNIVTLSRNL